MKHQQCIVTQLKREKEDIITFTLKGKYDNVLPFKAGQYISIHNDIGTMHVSRPYSIASSMKEASEQGYYQFAIQQAGDGYSSNYILNHWQVGTEVTLSEPLGYFTYDPEVDSKIVMAVVGGTSITPVRSLILSMLEGSLPIEHFILLYRVTTRDEALYYEEFNQWAERDSRFEVHYVFGREELLEGMHKYITPDYILAHEPKEAYSMYFCGPQTMQQSYEGKFDQFNIKPGCLHREILGEVHDPTLFEDYMPATQENYNLTVLVGEAPYEVNCPAKENIIYALEKSGIRIESGCRSGICGACESTLVSGYVFVPRAAHDYDPVNEHAGKIHLCRAYPLSDCVIRIR